MKQPAWLRAGEPQHLSLPSFPLHICAPQPHRQPEPPGVWGEGEGPGWRWGRLARPFSLRDPPPPAPFLDSNPARLPPWCLQSRAWAPPKGDAPRPTPSLQAGLVETEVGGEGGSPPRPSTAAAAAPAQQQPPEVFRGDARHASAMRALLASPGWRQVAADGLALLGSSCPPHRLSAPQ